MTEGHTSRLEAALAGRYKIERKLGEGGMASVYLAEDLKHERKVALKILRPELAAVIGAERFLSEIKTTANLQHPHILALFDSGQADGYLYYVMPYVDGETLRDKLDREKQLGVDESLRIARDVADALDYAHRHGVIHRDIKPGNILLHDGRPVVADFGIALAVSAAGGGRMTETGLSLGTPHYMSPEQASADRDLSARSDVYSLGCVLYEMLAGQPPHTGPSAQSILVHILTEEPKPLTSLRHTVPANVAAAVAKAIEKLPADRFESAKEFRSALEDAGFSYAARTRAATAVGAGVAPAGHAVAPRPWIRDTRSVAMTFLAAVMTLAFGWSLLRPEPPVDPAPTRRFAMELPASLRGSTGYPIGITADGERIIVNLAGDDGSNQLFLRSAGDLEMIPIRGTEGAGSFIVSPDGAWIALNAPEGLVRVPVDGGPPEIIVETSAQGGFRGASWGDDGMIVYANADHGGLQRVPAVGGVAEALTTPDSAVAHRSPHVLPGGEGVLFVLGAGGSDGSGFGEGEIALLSVESGEYEILTSGGEPHYVTGGFLSFYREGRLWAARLDLDARKLEGDPVPVASISRPFALSRNGTLVHVEGDASAGARLAVVDLEGNRQVLPLGPRNFDIFGPSWSPDGESVAFASDDQIYTYNTVLNTTPRQITFEGRNLFPVYSPDGTRIVFSSDRGGTTGIDLFVKDLNGDAPPRALLTMETSQLVVGWPADTLVVFNSGGMTPVDSYDLWLLDLSDPDAPEARPYLTSEADLRRMAVSPDGRLAAYRSNETGIDEIYIRSFPSPGERTLISRGGGSRPYWSPDGSTLYFTAAGGPFVAARLQREPVTAVLSLDTLFTIPTFAVEPFTGSALHPDGDRLIVAVPDGPDATSDSAPPHLILVQNFLTEVLERMGSN